MNLFHTVKSAVTTRMAAERYGLRVDGHGMVCCPFHGDKHPSMKVDERYYCFGCHETGDVIDFVGKLFGLSLFEAAKKLAADFGIDPTTPSSAALAVPVWVREKKQVQSALAVLIDYECLLKQQKERYAPQTPNEPFDERFASACHVLPYISYLADCLYAEDKETRLQIAAELHQSGMIAQLQTILTTGKDDERSRNAA